jgi:ABC-type glycerol-3-phosphate transport system substrate-binding protein
MKKLHIVILMILLLLFSITSCSGKNAVNSKDTLQKDTSERLVISAIFWSDSMDNLVKRFKKAHPDISIEVKKPVTEMKSNNDISEQREKMITELLSGNGADIYEIQLVSGYKYSQSGMFENLYDYMEKDASFNFDDYYTNIFKGCEFNGELNWAPQVFSYDFVRLNKNITKLIGTDIEIGDTMNYLDIYDLYQKAISANAADSDTVIESIVTASNALDPLEYRIYIDTNNLKCNYNSNNFIKYIDLFKQMPFSPYVNSSIVAANDSVEFDGKKKLLTIFRSNFTNWGNMYLETDTATKPILLVSSDSKYTYSVHGEGLAISKSSQNKELAWEFIKYIISEKEYVFDNENSENYYLNYPYPVFMPINKRNYEKLANFYSSGDKEIIDNINNINESLNAKSFYDPNLSVIIQEIQDDYFVNNLSTAEECAKQIQNRAELYLGE